MITFEDYLSQTIEKAVKEAVNEALKDIHKMIRRATTKEYLTTNEVMEFTGWSRRTVQHLRDTKQIEFTQHGRKILYPIDKLYEFFN